MQALVWHPKRRTQPVLIPGEAVIADNNGPHQLDPGGFHRAGGIIKGWIGR